MEISRPKQSRTHSGTVPASCLRFGSLEFVSIPSGRYHIGPAPDDIPRDRDEFAERVVAISSSLAIGRKPVTFDQWDAYRQDKQLAYSPSDMGWGRSQRPVINVSWCDVQDYLKWLSDKIGAICRLPTETEWEIAARAGTRTRYWWGQVPDRAFANYLTKRTSRSDHPPPARRTEPVGSYPANAWGLHDSLGTVWEWCADCWHSDTTETPEATKRYVLRGGAWDSDPHMIRSSYRTHLPGWVRMNNVGFRVLCEEPKSITPEC